MGQGQNMTLCLLLGDVSPTPAEVMISLAAPREIGNPTVTLL